MSEDIKIKYSTFGTQKSGNYGRTTLDNENDGVKINYNNFDVDSLNNYYQGSTLNNDNNTIIDYNNFDINHSNDYYRGASLNGNGDLKIAGNTFTTEHSRDYYKGTSFHWSGTWMIGTHYISDTYDIDYVIHEGALLVCVKSHLSSLENEPINFIRDDGGTIIGVDSEYWDFVLSGIAGLPGNTPGIKIIDNYWYICDNTSVPVEQQIWVNTGVRAKMIFADLTPEEIDELKRPAIEIVNNFLRNVIVQQKGNSTDKVMSQNAVSIELAPMTNAEIDAIWNSVKINYIE